MEQNIKALAVEDAASIEKQRNWVRDHYDLESLHLYETLEGKIGLIDTILKENWIEPNETWKLQSLGITFGDALAQKMDLVWVAVEDEYGCDPALHDRGTTIVMFPLTTISKRVERGEVVDVHALFENACQTIDRLRAELPKPNLNH